ncbi:hydrolase, partial [Pantoea ananatis]
ATFGKWGTQLSAVTGEHPHLLLAGVSTDFCVITTALAAADAGAWVKVVSDACAGSAPDNHEAALTVMDLYSPQIDVVTSSQVLATLA